MLTSLQGSDLRSADSLCFDHHADGTAVIRAIFRDNGHRPEYTVTVPVESSRVQNYGLGDGPWVCFAMIQSAQYDETARTLVRRMRAGSRLAFVWTRDNSSPVTKEVGIVVDMLDVKVQNGRVCDTFRVATFIGYDNTARMTRSVCTCEAAKGLYATHLSTCPAFGLPR